MTDTSYSKYAYASSGPVPDYLIDATPGAPAAHATFATARDAHLAASAVKGAADSRFSRAKYEAELGIGTTQTQDDALVESRTASTAAASAERDFKAAQAKLEDLLSGKSLSDSQLAARQSVIAGVVLDTHDEAVDALAALRQALTDRRRAHRYDGVGAGSYSPEVELLLECRRAGLDDAATDARFREAGYNPPRGGQVTERIEHGGRKDVTLDEALDVVARSLAQIPLRQLRAVRDGAAQ
ncbi:hypothetical protein QFZ62_000697 [Clavibacter sp. B3I6]|uniref:hypothetical protein n=1 Tax=Clavibacter sp. B3I6 TaxID=3042268 RepID=UPI0027829C17|nr:hypothetical protein [Clavibacter sp. B3I6]MDQ0743389.1 hypothetical protein [Clavibacter sp. B3I6]